MAARSMTPFPPDGYVPPPPSDEMLAHAEQTAAELAAIAAGEPLPPARPAEPAGDPS